MLAFYRRYTRAILGVGALVLALGIGWAWTQVASTASYYDGENYPVETFHSASTVMTVPSSAPMSDGVVLQTGYTTSALGGEAELRTEEQAQPADQSDASERIILRDATLTIQVEDSAEAIAVIGSMAEELGGWVVSANTNHASTYQYGSVIVRVPAQTLNTALERIRGASVNVTQEIINGRDVTEEYIDLASRLENLQVAEEQYQAILATAYKVADVLAVQAELTRVRGDIEVLQGRLRYFDEASRYSSITVNVTDYVPTVGTVNVSRWNPLETLENAFGNLIAFGQGTVDILIQVAVIGIPTLLIVLILARVGWVVGRWGWRLLWAKRA